MQRIRKIPTLFGHYAHFEGFPRNLSLVGASPTETASPPAFEWSCDMVRILSQALRPRCKRKPRCTPAFRSLGCRSGSASASLLQQVEHFSSCDLCSVERHLWPTGLFSQQHIQVRYDISGQQFVPGNELTGCPGIQHLD